MAVPINNSNRGSQKKLPATKITPISHAVSNSTEREEHTTPWEHTHPEPQHIPVDGLYIPNKTWQGLSTTLQISIYKPTI